MTFASELQAAALDIIKEFGSTAKLVTTDGQNLNGSAALINRNSQDNNGQHVISKTSTCYFTGTRIEPQPGDVLTIARTDYIVTQVERYNPDNKTNIVWKMEVST